MSQIKYVFTDIQLYQLVKFILLNYFIYDKYIFRINTNRYIQIKIHKNKKHHIT